jgi:hypothetical protein
MPVAPARSMLEGVSVIGDEAAARRLARAIIADVELYYARAEESALLSGVAEARGLFQVRVDPALHAVFEQSLGGTRLAVFAGGVATMPHPPLPAQPSATTTTRVNLGVVVGLALVMGVAAVVWFVATHGAR